MRCAVCCRRLISARSWTFWSPSRWLSGSSNRMSSGSHQGAADGDALLGAAGKVAHGVARHRAEAEELDHRVGPLRRGLRRHAAHRQREQDVVARGEVRIERVVLEHHRDVARARTERRHRAIVEEDLALAHRLDAGNHLQRRRLATAGRSEQRQHLALRADEVQIADGRNIAITLRDRLEPHRCHGQKASSCARRVLSAARLRRATHPAPDFPAKRIGVALKQLRRGRSVLDAPRIYFDDAIIVRKQGAQKM